MVQTRGKSNYDCEAGDALLQYLDQGACAGLLAPEGLLCLIHPVAKLRYAMRQGGRHRRRHNRRQNFA